MSQILGRGLLERGPQTFADWRTSKRKILLRDRLGKRFVSTLVGIGLVPVLAVAGLYFFAQAMSYESIDDAFIDAHTVDVAPKIAGRIEKVFIDDNWRVKKGDP
jgi:membrane fusion protein, multidrug efflux system